METVTISPQFEVTIPAEARRTLKLQPGQKLQVVLYDGRIELIPLTPIQALKGFLKGIDTDVLREPDRP